MTNTHEIEVACDTEQGEQFVEWLKKQGHSAKISRSTGDYVDGSWTSNNAEANEIMRRLWSEFCGSE